jgi:hypothetical protein
MEKLIGPLIIGVIVVLFVYLWYELITSRWEREDRRIDRFQTALFAAATLDFFLLFLPTLLQLEPLPKTLLSKSFVIFGGAIPLTVGALVVFRKGPARFAMPIVCLILMLVWYFIYYFSFIFAPDFP